MLYNRIKESSDFSFNQPYQDMKLQDISAERKKSCISQDKGMLSKKQSRRLIAQLANQVYDTIDDQFNRTRTKSEYHSKKNLRTELNETKGFRKPPKPSKPSRNFLPSIANSNTSQLLSTQILATSQHDSSASPIDSRKRSPM